MRIDFLSNTTKFPINFSLASFLPKGSTSNSFYEVPFHFTKIVFYYKTSFLIYKVKYNEFTHLYLNGDQLSLYPKNISEKISFIVTETKLLWSRNTTEKVILAIYNLYYLYKTNSKIPDLFTKPRQKKCSILEFFRQKNYTTLDKSTDFYFVYSNTENILIYGNRIIKKIFLKILNLKRISILKRFNINTSELKSLYISLVHPVYNKSVQNLNIYKKIENKNIKLIKIYNSKTKPIKIQILYKNKYKIFLYKPNTDLCNDLYISLITDFIYKLLNLKYKSTKILKDHNLIKIRSGKRLTRFKNVSDFKSYLHKGVSDTFIETYCVSLIVNYLFGVGDRNLDNMMVNRKGVFYNIDFEYILKEDPKYYFELVHPKVVAEFFLSDTLIYEKVKQTFLIYYRNLRLNYYKLLVFMKMSYKQTGCKWKYEKMETIFINNICIEDTNTLEKKFEKSFSRVRLNLTHYINNIAKRVGT